MQAMGHAAGGLDAEGDPYVISGRSGKLDRLEAMLGDVVAEGERALVFTQYAQMGHLLAAHLPGGEVEVLAEPEPYRPRANLRRRRALLAEHQARNGDPSPGGTRGEPIMTAYRQEALACAARLAAGPLRPRDLAGVTPRAGAILLRDVYGWFSRVERGVYGLSAQGQAALARWRL